MSISKLCSKYWNWITLQPVASIMIMGYGADVFVLLVHCHEMLPWGVHILTKQLLISKATAQNISRFISRYSHIVHILSRWDTTSYLPDICKATMVKVLTMGKTCIIMDKLTFPETWGLTWGRRLYLHVKLQHMDNQIGQHKAAAFCTHTDDPITNDRCIHPSMFLLWGLIYQAMVWSHTVRSTGYIFNLLCMSSK